MADEETGAIDQHGIPRHNVEKPPRIKRAQQIRRIAVLEQNVTDEEARKSEEEIDAVEEGIEILPDGRWVVYACTE